MAAILFFGMFQPFWSYKWFLLWRRAMLRTSTSFKRFLCINFGWPKSLRCFSRKYHLLTRGYSGPFSTRYIPFCNVFSMHETILQYQYFCINDLFLGTTATLQCYSGLPMGSSLATCYNGLWQPATLGPCGYGGQLLNFRILLIYTTGKCCNRKIESIWVISQTTGNIKHKFPYLN